MRSSALLPALAPSRSSRSATLVGLALALASTAPTAARAETPRIGVIVSSHVGLPADQSDQIAGDVATSVAARIDGETISGPAVRDLLPVGQPEPGCHDAPTCGRGLAKSLRVDEVLFLEVKRINKVIVVAMHRVARDPDRIPSEAQFRLAGPRAKRSKVVSDAVATLYPAGSVIPFEEPVAAPPPRLATAVEDDEEVAAEAALLKAKPQDDRPVYKKPWFIPVVVGAGAIVITGVALGIAFGIPPEPTATTITLP